ncbi:unnamed protein product [Effrenium voratum]|uniref:Uncharacterized protein n=1 Tax=Effrenium voratum TaxID=2562239 RepID=A0AA36MXN6_9DINO|nr:unnamed protein product [Effrenium voratum]
MPALPVLCREALAETLKQSLVQRATAEELPLRFDGFLTLAAARALMMLFILLGIILAGLWRVVEISDPDPVQEEENQKRKLLAVDKLLKSELSPPPPEVPSLPVPELPQICAPYMRAMQGADLCLALPREGAGPVQVLGLGSAQRGPAVCLLSARLAGGVLELVEQEPGKGEDASGEVLLKGTADGKLWRGGELLATLRAAPLGGHGCLRQRFLLEGDTLKEALVLSASKTRLELGLADSGRRLAAAEGGGKARGRCSFCPRLHPHGQAVHSRGQVV